MASNTEKEDEELTIPRTAMNKLIKDIGIAYLFLI